MKKITSYILAGFLLGCTAENPEPVFDAPIEWKEFYTSYGVRCLDTLVSHSGKEIPAFGSVKSFGPPKGAGQNGGSLDVFVIGEGKEAIFEIQGYTAANQNGIDLKVFENGFESTSGTYAWDLGTLQVSPDNIHWYGFEPKHVPPNNQITGKTNLIGLHPVITNYEDNSINPRLDAAGGDGFDLANAKLITDNSSGNPLTFEYGTSLIENIRYFKIVDGGSTLPDGQVQSNGVDIDGFCIFNPEK
ncbi:hypothetical protein HQ489_01410 [Candidatus Woesearchaeota archaeon]|nr:hypothetical protein [Candidatus Woesearchaeota archaeon]